MTISPAGVLTRRQRNRTTAVKKHVGIIMFRPPNLEEIMFSGEVGMWDWRRITGLRASLDQDGR